MRRTILVVVLAGSAWFSAPAAEPPASWAVQAQTKVADSEYELSRQETAWQAPNRAHGFRTTFDGDGIHVAPRMPQATSWSWGLTLIGCESVASLSVHGNRITYDRGRIVEWYVNDARGLEQGFRLDAPLVETRGETHLDLSLTGSLHPSIATDGQAIDFVAPGGAIVLRYASMKIVDARGHVLASRMEGFTQPGIRGIRLVFDDADAVYPVTFDALTTSAAWTASGQQDLAWFGRSVATAGDVNGDGYSDVIVGAPLYDNGQSDEGRAFVFLGSASGLAAAPGWTAESDQADAYFGWSVAPAGDVNGDGYSDVIVGASQYGNGQLQEGRAFLYLGSAAGLTPTPAWTAESNQSGAYFGSAVATAGDVNGDGYADVLVSAPEYGFGLGRVYAYLGSASGLAPTPAWTKDGAQDAEFGNSVATAGDVNGDGYADVVIGAENHDTDQIFEGRAYLYLGSASGLAATAAWTAEGNSNGAHFGHSVATAGDVNGDGYADVIVGADAYTGGQSAEGRAFVYFGSVSGLATTPNWFSEPHVANTRFGSSVATAGDVNGDGAADIIIGSARSGGAPGSAEVRFGSASGGLFNNGWSVDATATAGDRLGFSVGTAGDVNGDGYSDVIAGAYQFNDGHPSAGGAFLQLGSALTPAEFESWSATGAQPTAIFGWSLGPAGDVNGDGYSDVIVGAPYYDNGEADEGLALVFLGSAGGLSQDAAWTVEGNQFGARLGDAVAGAGDVNGDGYSDVIVGALWYDDGSSNEGAAFVYLGSASGLAPSAAWTAEGNQANVDFGDSVAGAGDVNGDGYSDVIVGATWYNNDQVGEGRAFVYLGSASGLASTPVWTAESDQSGSEYGWYVATAGDVNGDGYSDVIVGARSYDHGEGEEGRAFVYHGSPNGPATAASWTAESDKSAAYFGNSVAPAGDVNGDGFADVIIGAYGFSNAHNSAGKAYVYVGSAAGLAASPAWTKEGLQTSQFLGGSVGSAGDVNGDGYADIIVGSDGLADPWTRSGAAEIFLGSAAGPDVDPVWHGTLGWEETQFGYLVASAGDVNGDGYSDVIVGSPFYDTNPTTGGNVGHVSVYYGGGRDGLDRIPRQARADGTPLALLGKSDSETAFRAVVRGRTAAGRGRIRLNSEAKPLGSTFNGAGLGLSAVTMTSTPGATGSFVSFDTPVEGLSEGTFYHWRVRTVSSDPFFLHTTWVSPAGLGMTETKIRTSGCVDQDGDGYGASIDPSCVTAVLDCNDVNGSVWAIPGTTANLRVGADKTTWLWDAPSVPGGLASTLVYDTIRASQPAGFMTGVCVESDDGPNTTASEPATPAAGQGFFYLNRAQNACPTGAGSLGTTSAGAPRMGVSCP